MDRTYVPVVTAGLVAILLSVTGHVIPIRLATLGTPTPERLTFLTRAANVVAFLSTFVVLLGVAYWAGTTLNVSRRYGTLGIFTFLSATVGYLIGFLTIVLSTLTIGDQGLLAMVALTVGPSIATGVKLAVVVVAGASIAHYR